MCSTLLCMLGFVGSSRTEPEKVRLDHARPPSVAPPISMLYQVKGPSSSSSSRLIEFGGRRKSSGSCFDLIMHGFFHHRGLIHRGDLIRPAPRGAGRGAEQASAAPIQVDRGVLRHGSSVGPHSLRFLAHPKQADRSLKTLKRPLHIEGPAPTPWAPWFSWS